MKHIAVISKDLQDFLSWKDEMGLGTGKIIDTKKKFEVDGKTYHCIYKPTHTISLTLDSIVETKNARNNDTYSSVLGHAQRCLKSQ